MHDTGADSTDLSTDQLSAGLLSDYLLALRSLLNRNGDDLIAYLPVLRPGASPKRLMRAADTLCPVDSEVLEKEFIDFLDWNKREKYPRVTRQLQHDLEDSLKRER